MHWLLLSELISVKVCGSVAEHRLLRLIALLSPEEALMLRMWCRAVNTYSAADIERQSQLTVPSTCHVHMTLASLLVFCSLFRLEPALGVVPCGRSQDLNTE